MQQSQKRLVSIFIGMVAVAALLIAGWFVAREIRSPSIVTLQVEREAVGKIVLQHTPDDRLELENQEILDKIVTDLNGKRFQRGQSCRDSAGIGICMTLYDQSGQALDGYQFNTGSSMRGTDYFYDAQEEGIDYQYLCDLLNRQIAGE